MAMAQAAGATGIGVAWGYHPVDALHAAGARAVIGDFAELMPALEQVWAPLEPAGAAPRRVGP